MFKEELSRLNQQHLLRRPMVIETYDGPRVVISRKSLLLMCSNDYLGLAGHPSLQEAAQSAMERFGFGSGASRLISGTSDLHRELEERLARFKDTEAALVFNSGYAANTGVIPALAGEGDVILSDGLNHASIIDGCRLSWARTLVYRHKDMDHLEDLLKDCAGAGRRLIVTDGVFSMDGDIAPLPDLATLAERYDALLMVDDAHATGVLGPGGRGTSEHFGLQDRVQVRMGTLGKALGSFGAYVAGTRDLIDFLINRSRSYIFSTALPPAVCAASIAALAVVQQEPDRRERLWRNRERFAAGLRSFGISTGSSEAPIIPLMIGASDKALHAGAALFEDGIFATAIRPPSVPENSARIRMTVTAAHSDHDIDAALAAIGRVQAKGLIP